MNSITSIKLSKKVSPNIAASDASFPPNLMSLLSIICWGVEKLIDEFEPKNIDFSALIKI